jgi:ribosome biogenesis GTPase / thiamine phosphate phosphatase
MVQLLIHRRHGGYFYGLDPQGTEISCRLRGVLRKDKDTKNLVVVGDQVMVELQSQTEGIIVSICERTSVLRRAKGFRIKEGGKQSSQGQILIANIDQVLIIIPALEPSFHPLLVDRFLALVAAMQLNPILIIHKWDLLKNTADLQASLKVYQTAGFTVLPYSIEKPIHHPEFQILLNGKTSFLMGPSGAGKSSIVHHLNSDLDVRVGEWSERCRSGRQTTSSTRIYPLWEKTYLADTPGFSQVFLHHLPRKSLRNCYPEFLSLPGCRYQDCLHDGEDECQVPESVEKGLMDSGRYARYRKLLEECGE